MTDAIIAITARLHARNFAINPGMVFVARLSGPPRLEVDVYSS